MRNAIAAGFSLVILTLPVAAQPYYESPRAENALRDAARAQERQAESLRRMEQIEHERNLREDRAQRNADTMSRSSRRFDRH
jgi:hypothetical protein